MQSLSHTTATTLSSNLIPLITTPPGSCLTANNWQETGIKKISFELASLILKPGLSYLKSLPEFSSYYPWDKDWILNAANLIPHSDYSYLIKSHFDGARLICTIDEIIDLILVLKPAFALLPLKFYRNAQHRQAQITKTALFISHSELNDYSFSSIHGLYFAFDEHEANQNKLLNLMDEYRRTHPQFQHYALQSNTLPIIKELIRKEKAPLLETDFFAHQGYQGQVLANGEMIDLKDPKYALQFVPIDEVCKCPTCSQGFTRAYLYHLFEHTPLLCQRMLIQHNVYHALTLN